MIQGWASSPGPAGWERPSGSGRWCAAGVLDPPSPSLSSRKTLIICLNILDPIRNKFSFLRGSYSQIN